MPTLGYPRQSCIAMHAGHQWATIGTKIDSWYPLSPKANDRRPFLSFQISFIKQKKLNENWLWKKWPKKSADFGHSQKEQLIVNF